MNKKDPSCHALLLNFNHNKNKNKNKKNHLSRFKITCKNSKINSKKSKNGNFCESPLICPLCLSNIHFHGHNQDPMFVQKRFWTKKFCFFVINRKECRICGFTFHSICLQSYNRSEEKIPEICRF